MGDERKTPLKVLALTRYGRLGASSRLRTYQYVPHLHSMGIHMRVMPLFGDEYVRRLYSGRRLDWPAVSWGYLRRAGQLLRAGSHDVVWVEKELFPSLPAWLERTLPSLGVSFVADYDDAVFHNYDGKRGRRSRALRQKIDHVMRAASAVVCGSPYLADHARSCGAPRVEFVPTVIDLDRYPVIDTSQRRSHVVGWIGTPMNSKYLDVARPALEAVAQRLPLQLRVIGAEYAVPDLDVDCRAWAERSEVSDLAECSVGIMPLFDAPWERGKCGYKIIQYMACGLPVVASPVGVNTEIIEHGRDGFLATTLEEWSDAIERLLSDPGLAARMGAAGRRKIEGRYSLQVAAPRLAGVLRSVAGDKRAPGQNEPRGRSPGMGRLR
jgi:glycosyltransferase involved in cell wall biosynthesis